MKCWEKDVVLNFDPSSVNLRRLQYKTYRGEAVQEGTFLNRCRAESVLESHVNGETPSLGNLLFPDPDNFVAGQIHEHVQEWNHIIPDSEMKEEIMSWVQDGVDINRYIRPFKGVFGGQHYDHNFPPPRVFNNSDKCKDFIPFISETIHERLQNGSIGYAGKVGVDPPPHIVAPLTVEPTKPRLCVNMMYLNNWIVDRPFRLDGLKDIPKTARENAFYTSTDDKSGYDNVCTNYRCHHLLGFQWAGHYYVAKTLSFGFKLSAFFYNLLNMQAVSYIRKMFNIPIFLYIDDRLIEEVRDSRVQKGYQSAMIASYITCEIVLRLGFCLSLKKSVFVPTQTPVFLGFIVDSINRCFRLTDAKRNKFIELREFCLSQQAVSVSCLQKLAGRCISFMLAVPAAKLYTREINRGISKAIKLGGYIMISGELSEEITYWRFLDNWQGMLKWKDEKHLVVSMSTDSSLYKWGGRVTLPHKGDIEASDFWPDNMKQLPIMVLEAYALRNVLRAFASNIRSSRVDAQVDNTSLIAAWNNEGCRSSELNTAIKDIFSITLEYDILLNLIFVPSAENQADEASRAIRKSDASLSDVYWCQIQKYFGGTTGHTCDLMALDSNAKKDRNGHVLPHFTPCPTPHSTGVNVFSQDINASENYYVFPPFSLTLPILKFITDNNARSSVVIKCEDNTPVWLPAMQENIADAFLIGLRGQKDCLSFPSRRGFVRDQKGLMDNLWVIRLEPDVEQISYGKLLFCKHPNVSKYNRLLCIGDSILRDTDKEGPFHNPLVSVSVLGGATVGYVGHVLRLSVEQHFPYAVVVHCGVNNLSKVHKYTDEYQQMSITFSELSCLENDLRSVCLRLGSKILLSQCLTTRIPDVNARATLYNKELATMCQRNGWFYIKHKNINQLHLRDNVHLTATGRSLFVRNIMGAIEQVM